jgi:hypothetical protein
MLQHPLSVEGVQPPAARFLAGPDLAWRPTERLLRFAPRFDDRCTTETPATLDRPVADKPPLFRLTIAALSKTERRQLRMMELLYSLRPCRDAASGRQDSPARGALAPPASRPTPCRPK